MRGALSNRGGEGGLKADRLRVENTVATCSQWLRFQNGGTGAPF